MRHHFSLAYYAAAGLEMPTLGQGIQNFTDTGGRVSVHAKTGNQLFDEKQINAFVNHCMTVDIIIISLHGGRESCPAFDALETRMAQCRESGEPLPWLHVQPTGGDEDALETARQYSTHFGTSAWDTVYEYIRHGGTVNFTGLLSFLESELFHLDREVPAPTALPHEGIYHPDIEGIPEFEEYLAQRVNPDNPTVGLWFNHAYWLNNNLEYIDAMIRAVEDRGANIIPIFHMRFKDATIGNKGAEYAVRKFFMKDGTSIIDVLISPNMFSLTLMDPTCKDLFADLGVPVIQAMMTLQPYESWNAEVQGMTTMEVSFSAAQPEFDGNLITVPVSSREQDTTDPLTGALITRYVPIPDRIDQMVNLALNWGRLKRTPNAQKKVAIIFHHYPPRNDRIGCAAGLDSFASVTHLLKAMKENGYGVETFYDGDDELAHEILSKMTCDQRWLLPEQMHERAAALAGPEEYLPWHEGLPESIREKQTQDWGEMPGDLFVHEQEMVFPGTLNGNIFITVQPPRGYLENIDKMYHDMYLSPPHHYLAQYRFIKHVFKADAVIHVGKHGSLEWLPGKALGLSKWCYPDLSIMDLPNIYPYIINDPSEGTQAKRRSYCCIVDHLTPVFTNADLYESLADVDNHVKSYQDAKREDPGKLAVLQPMIWEAVVQANLDTDLDITQDAAFKDFDGFLEKLHRYLGELSDTMINDGLHTLGQVPGGQRLVEFLVQLTRVANGDIPSLRDSLVRSLGYEYDHLLDNRGKVVDADTGLTGNMLIAQAHTLALALIEKMADANFDSTQDALMTGVTAVVSNPHPDTMEVLGYLAAAVVPNIRKTTEEMDAVLAALDGGFVRPGPSGAPTRGQADILPTGRNFYSVDPNKIPTPAAWTVGQRLGDALLQRYLDETGGYPRSVGILVYGGPTMRSGGDDVAEILYLMGVKPIWHPTNGTVKGLEIIPQKELGRPRIDVLPRISGFFRDSFPLLVQRIDEAVAMVATLDDPIDTNMIRRHVIRDMKQFKMDGLDEKEAFREASFRVFGCPPGTYGAGVSELVESKNWETQDDLGNNYIRYSSHAYGKGSYGKQKPKVFRRLLSRMDVTVKNEDSREYDMMSCTDYYNYYGGLIVAGKTVTGKYPLSLMGDSADPKRVKMRTTAEEAKHVLRSRLTNPKWIQGMMRHGYKGAGDISHMMDVALGWDATAEVMDDWMYDQMARAYVLDPAVKEWMEQVNPYARQNILDKLLEAIARGMWDADKEIADQLREEYLEVEGDIEALTE